MARLGTFVHVPAGTTHWFRFGAGGGEMVSLTSGAGAAKMFADVDREIAPVKPAWSEDAELGGSAPQVLRLSLIVPIELPWLPLYSSTTTTPWSMT